MRRILLAAGLALLLHGLLLMIKDDLFVRERDLLKRPEPITLSLTRRVPEKKPLPVLRIPELPREKPPEKELTPVLRIPERPREKPLLKKKQPEKREKRIKPPPIKRIQPVVKKPLKKETINPEINEPSHSPSPPPKESYETLPVEPEGDDRMEIPTEIPVDEPDQQEMQTGVVKTSPPPPQAVKEASPLYKENPIPKYPKTAIRRGYKGTVILEVLVNKEGRVDDLRLNQSSGYGILDRAAMTSVREWLFEPGKRGDQKVEMWVMVPVRFELK